MPPLDRAPAAWQAVADLGTGGSWPLRPLVISAKDPFLRQHMTCACSSDSLLGCCGLRRFLAAYCDRSVPLDPRWPGGPERDVSPVERALSSLRAVELAVRFQSDGTGNGDGQMG